MSVFLSEALQVPMLVKKPGDFFVIGGIQWYTQDDLGNLLLYDTAKAMGPSRIIIAYHDPLF